MVTGVLGVWCDVHREPRDCHALQRKMPPGAVSLQERARCFHASARERVYPAAALTALNAASLCSRPGYHQVASAWPSIDVATWTSLADRANPRRHSPLAVSDIARLYSSLVLSDIASSTRRG